MTKKTSTKQSKPSTEKLIKDIRRSTAKVYSCEQKRKQKSLNWFPLAAKESINGFIRSVYIGRGIKGLAFSLSSIMIYAFLQRQ